VTQVYYDAFNRAMTINRSGTYTNHLFTAAGQRYATMTGGTWQKYFLPLPAGMQAVYTPSGLQYYRHADWLGSSRFASTPSGAVQYSLAYAPFGETYSESGTVDRSFTGQTQDTVAGSTALYDFTFRQHASSQGRWLVPDPAGLTAVDPTNPQTWNRYAYLANNPLNGVDPLGLDRCTWDDGSEVSTEDGGGDSYSCGQVGGNWVEGANHDVNVSDGGDWVLNPGCSQFGGSPGVGCDGGGWRNIELFHLPSNTRIPTGTLVSRQPQAITQSSQQMGCRAGQHCSEAYKQCESNLFYRAFAAGIYAAGGAVTDLPDEVKQLWQYLSNNRYAVGAVASVTATSMYALSEATSATVGAAVSNWMIPGAAVGIGVWAGKQGIDAYKLYIDQNSGNCERL
jgi:RHS repeat-associated protein